MPTEQVSLTTTDGVCPTSVFTPSAGEGPWPAVIFYMDGFGIRPALFDMAQRLADAGYVVVMPDLYYRAGSYEPLDVAGIISSGSVREALGAFMVSIDNVRAAADTQAVLDYIDTRTDVTPGKIGTTGYCLGGGLSLTAAGKFPERVAAAASFHGGSLATDSDSSPHLLADAITAQVYVGAADKDSSYPADMAGRLVEALTAASVNYRHDLYVGAAHGWTIPDFPMFNADANERHWTELLALLTSAL